MRRILSCMLAVTVAAAFSTASAQDADALRTQAAAAMSAGKYTAAVAAYKQLIAATPSDASAYEGLGNAYTKLGKHKEAADAFEKQADVLIGGAAASPPAAPDAAPAAAPPAPAAEPQADQPQPAAPRAQPQAHAARVTRAAPADAAPRTAAGPGGRPTPGHYECGFFAGGRLQRSPGFDLRAAGTYKFEDGSTGRYSVDASNVVTFQGGSFDGQAGLLDLSGARSVIRVYNAARSRTVIDCEVSGK